MVRELTTTSYALLSLLAVRPWTTYELKQQMSRSVRVMWPRAASVLYEEPKKLVDHGLAESRAEYTGRRRSTVYEITDAGREALRGWLRAQLRSIREEAEKRRARIAARFAEYTDGGGPYPDRLPVIALAGRFQHEQNQALLRWAAWAENETASWTGVTPDTGARVPPDAFDISG